MAPTAPARTRRDRCPGVLRPWPADDGALVRVRLPGGRISATALRGLAAVAAQHGDGDLHLTARANLQLRALPSRDGRLTASVLAAVEATGVLPSRAHDRARNLMASPLTGLAGGRADLRPVVADLDAGLRADPVLAALPGRFLLALDDGRGDLADRDADLGLVALDAVTAQVRVGADGWGPVLPLAEAPAVLLRLARAFLRVRGAGEEAAWHVDELAAPLLSAHHVDPRALVRSAPPDPGTHAPGVRLHAVPEGRLTPTVLDRVLAAVDGLPPRHLVLTPWHGVVTDPTPEVIR